MRNLHGGSQPTHETRAVPLITMRSPGATGTSFRPQLLKDGFAYVNKNKLEVTDDVSIIEHLGEPVRITKGSYENLKVTTPEDLLIAERLLDERAAAAAATVQPLYTAGTTDAADPMEKFCEEDPAADECRVYED
jgi:hypothetical protein